MVPVVEAILGSHGGLPREARVLDFGCGVGRHTREFRAAGYAAEGIDIAYEGLVEERAALPDGGANLYLSDASGNFPFPDDSFDLCFSTSVLEHVIEYDKPLSEIARVLRAGAWTVHVFPSRWRPIEPHIFVPFGGRFQTRSWYKLWARAGIRNAHQQGLDASEVADRNVRYAATGINYPTARQIEYAFRAHFSEFQFIEDEFVAATSQVSRASRIAAPLIGLPGMKSAYRALHTRVVLARNS
jgi:SAM-dependent methyltransferase